MNVLVTGGRYYSNDLMVYEALDEAKPTIVVNGGATGADTLSTRWCDMNGVPCAIFPPAWTKLSRAGGMIRNKWMLQFIEIELVLAFPGNRGTEGMIRLAEAENIHVKRIGW